jgi:hypothetical protein
MFAWRNYLEVHPAADDYPLLKDSDPAAFRELVEDIRKHGLRANIVLWEGDGGKRWLLDGRNRLDALADLGVLYDIDGELGLKSWTGTKWAELSGCALSVTHQAVPDGAPYALAASLNVHRRHLTPEERRGRIEAAIKRNPEKSDRAIGEEVGHDHKTVGGVRREMEDVGSIPHVETRKDTKGRKQPAKKAKAITKPAPEQNEPEASAERMKAAHAVGNITLTFEDLIDQICRVRRMAEGLPKLLGHLDDLSDHQRRELLAAIHEAAEAWTTLGAAAAEKPEPASDNDLEIPGFLRRIAQATQ